MLKFIKKFFSREKNLQREVLEKRGYSVNRGQNSQTLSGDQSSDKNLPRIKRYWNPRTGATREVIEFEGLTFGNNKKEKKPKNNNLMMPLSLEKESTRAYQGTDENSISLIGMLRAYLTAFLLYNGELMRKEKVRPDGSTETIYTFTVSGSRAQLKMLSRAEALFKDEGYVIARYKNKPGRKRRYIYQYQEEREVIIFAEYILAFAARDSLETPNPILKEFYNDWYRPDPKNSEVYVKRIPAAYTTTLYTYLNRCSLGYAYCLIGIEWPYTSNMIGFNLSAFPLEDVFTFKNFLNACYRLPVEEQVGSKVAQIVSDPSEVKGVVVLTDVVDIITVLRSIVEFVAIEFYSKLNSWALESLGYEVADDLNLGPAIIPLELEPWKELTERSLYNTEVDQNERKKEH